VSDAGAVDQVTTLAEELTRGTWQEIATELGGLGAEAKEIKRELASHAWCDMFVGLVQAIEKFNEALDRIPDIAKVVVKRAILGSSMQGKRTHVTEAVVNVVVDKVWAAFKTAIFAKVPLFNITNDEVLRALRILAVFTCPAPEDHEEVRTHALKPLGDDIDTILNNQTKNRLAELFAEWRPEENGRPNG
jgi:hypothetical protein